MNTTNEDDNQILIDKTFQLILDENVGLRNAMKRIESLLKHSVELMNESVSTAHSTIHTHQTILNKAVNPEPEQSAEVPGDQLLTTLRKALGITIQLNAILSKTTRSLQVEDIVSQIVKDVSKRSLKMDIVVNSIQDMKKNTFTPQSTQEILKVIEELHITAQKNPIKQISLDEGEIELF
ncbi:MAG: hypothetical protein JSS07_09285 [Proteobacteria bacterium]|nr:hypothetical protein [Pseudomonadota bacterium]